jgi:hypothetical protein
VDPRAVFTVPEGRAVIGLWRARRPVAVFAVALTLATVWKVTIGTGVLVTALVLAGLAVVVAVVKAPSGGTTVHGRRWIAWSEAGYPTSWPDVIASDPASADD